MYNWEDGLQGEMQVWPVAPFSSPSTPTSTNSTAEYLFVTDGMSGSCQGSRKPMSQAPQANGSLSQHREKEEKLVLILAGFLRLLFLLALQSIHIRLQQVTICNLKLVDLLSMNDRAYLLISVYSSH